MNYIIFRKLLLGSLFLLFLNPVVSQNKFTVVIDPGHGDHDGGTRTKEGISEKDINLLVSKFVESYIEEYAPNIEVILTRENDIFLPLKKRPLFAKMTNADLFISIHCNHSTRKYARGLEVYVQKNGEKNSLENTKKAYLFGLLLDSIVKEKLNYKSRGVKSANFSVLRNSIQYVPSVLVELGFFSNKTESQYLTSKKGINGISLGIAKTIIDYFEE